MQPLITHHDTAPSSSPIRRFLVPLLLVHGNLSYYRLARLIKYSFYKNITFAFVLFYYQFYNGFSGQALVDSITAAVYNVIFTSLPILLFSILDRPVKNLKALMRYPQVMKCCGDPANMRCGWPGRGLTSLSNSLSLQLYDKRQTTSLTTASFWKTGVLMGAVHGAVCFFIPYYSLATSGSHNITDVYSLGKITFVAMLGTVSLEVALIARYWTWLFGAFTVISYVLVYPYMLVFPELGRSRSGCRQVMYYMLFLAWFLACPAAAPFPCVPLQSWHSLTTTLPILAWRWRSWPLRPFGSAFSSATSSHSGPAMLSAPTCGPSSHRTPTSFPRRSGRTV